MRPSTAAEKDLRGVLDRYLAPQLARLQAELSRQSGSAKLRNSLGVLYARFGMLDEAAREFRAATTVRAPYAPALVNLGTIAYTKRDLQMAADQFEQALRADPRNAAALLGVARVNFELENYGATRASLEKLKQVDPGLAEKFAYLSGKTDQATRASSQAAREEAVWSDE